MYYVYYVKGVKVGCTKDVKKRVEEEQGYKDYIILYETEDIKKASNAERFYQEKLGYKVDSNTYEELTLSKNKKQDMLSITKQTITFKVEPKLIDKDFLLKIGEIKDVNGVDIKICEELADWILSNLKQSQFNNEKFVYNQSLINAYEFIKENKAITKVSVFNKIREWAKERGLYEKGDGKTQYVKLQEEAGELAKALLKDDKEEIVDAIGDIVVVLTNLAHLEGFKIEECVESAYNVIKSRKGKMVNGTFVKNE